MTYFKPYEGGEPFIFISYAHADAEAVMPVVDDLHRRGYNVWYDEGIDVGSEWTECIASHLAEAALMIGFVSPSYIASANCRREMNYAVQKKKRLINIFIAPTDLTPGMELQIGGIWALMKYTYPSDEYFYEKLYQAPALRDGGCGGEERASAAPAEPAKPAGEKGRKKEKPVRARPAKPDGGRGRRTWRAVLAVLLGLVLVAAVVLGVIGTRLGLVQRILNKTVGSTGEVATLAPETEAEFVNPVFEAAAREYCGKESGAVTVGDLTGLTELYVCGDGYSFLVPQEPSLPGATTSDLERETAEGRVIKRGGVTDLSDLRYFPSLTTLGLEFQSLASLETMPAVSVSRLYLAGNRETSLAGVQNLPNLEAIFTDGDPISDISALSGCIRLTQLRLTGATVTDFDALKGLPAIDSLCLSDAALSQLKPALMPNTLSSVELCDCDLRGQLFDILDSPKLMTLTLVRCTVDDFTGVEELTGLTSVVAEHCVGDFSLLASLTAAQVTVR